MPFSLIPDRVFARYADITPEYLQQQGITLLLFAEPIRRRQKTRWMRRASGSWSSPTTAPAAG